MKKKEKVTANQVNLQELLKDSTQRQALIRLYSLLYEIDQRNRDAFTREANQENV